MPRTITIHFEKVGRGKYTEDMPFVIPDDYQPTPDIAAMAWKEVRKHLISSDVECTYDPQANEGTVRAGWHTVGHFQVKR